MDSQVRLFKDMVSNIHFSFPKRSSFAFNKYFEDRAFHIFCEQSEAENLKCPGLVQGSKRRKKENVRLKS